MHEGKSPNQLLAESLIAIAGDFAAEYAGRLLDTALSGRHGSLPNPLHAGNFLSELDLELDRRYEERLRAILPPFIYLSEEREPPSDLPTGAQGPELAVLVDPLDSTELAVRALRAHTHVLVYSLREQRPLACVVGDFFHHVRFFFAFRDGRDRDRAFLIAGDGDPRALAPSRETSLSRSLVTNYSMNPRDRFLRIAEQRRLLEGLSQPDESGQRRGRIGLDFASIGLCHVAAGFSEAMIEIASGFALWDLLPGQYILQAAGGLITTPRGEELPLDLGLHTAHDIRLAMDRRQQFVAAGNAALHAAIMESLTPDR